MLKCYITNYFLKEFLMILKVVISEEKQDAKFLLYVILTMNF